MTKEQIFKEVESGKWQPEFKYTDNLDAAVDDILKPHEDYFLKLHDKVKEIIEREIEHYEVECMSISGNPTYKITFADTCNWQKELFEHKQSIIQKHANNISIFKNNKVYGSESSINDLKISQKAINLPNQYIELGLRTKIGTKVGGEICNGKIRMFDTPDNRDIWVCKNCNKEYSFDFNMDRCNNIINAWEPPHPMHLNDLISMCFPVAIQDLISNYSLVCGFQNKSQERFNNKVEADKFYLHALTEWYKTFEVIHFYEDLNGRVGGIIINILSYILTGHYLIKK